MLKHVWRGAAAAVVLFVGCTVAPESTPEENGGGVVNNAPARTSAAPMHVKVVSKGNAKPVTASGPNVDWNVTTTAPVKASPAVTGPDFSTLSNTDVFAFGVANSGTARGITGSSQINNGWAAAAVDAGIFVFTNLYDASLKPDLLVYALDNDTTQKFTSGGLVFNIAGTRLYALSQTGKLFCFTVPAGGPVGGAATRATTCSGWTDYTGGNTVTVSSIWPVYDGTGAVTTLYYGDDAGKIHKVNGSTGASQWGANGGVINSPASQLGPPVVVTDTTTLNNVVYVGDNKGRYFRLIDTGSTPSSATPSSYDLCGGGPGSCATNYWGVVTSPAVDMTELKSYVASGGQIFEFPVSSTATWAPVQPAKVIASTPTAQIYSNPILDPDNMWLYVGHNNKLWKIKYPFDGSTTTNIYSTTLQKSGADASYPRGQALPYLGQVWIGTGTGTDGNGLAEQYGCGGTSNATAPALTGRSLLTYGAYIGTPLVFDYLTGNVNFGYQNSAGTGGGAVQYKSTGSPDWDCGSLQSIAGLACGSAGCAAGCAVPGDCPGTNQSTVTCTVPPTCGGTCNAGYADCNANKNTDGCEINTNTDVSNCGSCGNACSTNHIFTPTCTTGTCGGACDVGYYDCNANVADGCEGGGTCTDCCGVACGAGNSCVNGVCSPFTGGTVAYSVPSSTNGNQSWPYGLGMDFDVSSQVTITQLGAFDSGSNGLSSTITVYIYDRDTQQQIASQTFTPASPGILVGGSRYKTLSCPVSLPAGFRGKVVADGYSASEQNGNSGGAAPTWSTNTAGGKITYVNSATYSTSAGVYPTNIDGGPANRYAAGTFVVGTGGGCGVPGDCPGNNQSTVTCAAGICGGTCSAGYDDCNGSKNTDGCETPTTSDTNNCGACGVVCSTNHISSPGCSAGVCASNCDSGYANCNGLASDGCEGNGTCADCCGVTCSGGTPVCSAGACVAAPATVVAYSVPNGTVGTQTYVGSIGMDFDVVTAIMVTELGVFDSSQNGLGGNVTAYIYNRDTQAVVTSLLFTTASPGTLTDGSRYKSITCPIVLPVGFHGSIVIDSGNELNGNSMGGGPTWSTNSNGGLISFTGTGRYGSTGAYPGTADGGPVNRYAGGTFKFGAAP